MTLLCTFQEAEAQNIVLAGGKGVNLARLTHAGFTVPPGIIATTAMYRQFVSTIPRYTDTVAQLQSTEAACIRECAESIQRMLEEQALPAEMMTAIAEQLQAFGGTTFSVRSSSIFEDRDLAAFAGQHDTYLGIARNAIAQHVVKCFASLWCERAVLYRRARGFDQRQAAMAVVIQQMVASASSGVLFTMHPVTGRFHEMAIDANFGLGESVVAGEAQVDHFVLDKATLEIQSERIGDKEHALHLTDIGVEVREQSHNEACITHDQLRALGETTKAIEAHYQFPQDIEWAFAPDGSLQILQSRPVTTIVPRWTRDESAERFPNPMTPLGWEFSEKGFHRSLRFSLHLMGLPLFDGKWFAIFNNYIYGNQNAVDVYLKHRNLPFQSLEELRTMLPVITTHYRWMIELPARWMRDLDRYLIRVGQLDQKVQGTDIGELWETIQGIDRVGSSYFEPNIAISIGHGFLHKVLFQVLGLGFGADAAKGLYDRLTRYCETKTSLINKELYDLYLLAKEGGTDAARFTEAFDKFVGDHAHREVDPDPYQPMWGDAPNMIMDQITLMLGNESIADPYARELESKRIQLAAEQEVLEQLPEDLHLFFTELLRLARVYSALDDVEHYQTTRLNWLFRRAMLSMGALLQHQGHIDETGDLFFGSQALIQEALTNNDWKPLKKRIEAAKAVYQKNGATAPPWALDDDASTEEVSERALRGIPGAPGVIEGKIYLVHSVAEFKTFPAGAILVARTTNPAWTPLFYNAVGVITESGGPLSHGAVTAREMHIPAVMAVKGCMHAFTNGQHVRIDGSQGTVEIIGT